MTARMAPRDSLQVWKRTAMYRKISTSVKNSAHMALTRSSLPTCGPTTSSCATWAAARSEEHTSELQSRLHLVCRLLLEKKKTRDTGNIVETPFSYVSSFWCD